MNVLVDPEMSGYSRRLKIMLPRATLAAAKLAIGLELPLVVLNNKKKSKQDQEFWLNKLKIKEKRS